jgi:hypothetical protein
MLIRLAIRSCLSIGSFLMSVRVAEKRLALCTNKVYLMLYCTNHELSVVVTRNVELSERYQNDLIDTGNNEQTAYGVDSR